jgi:GNAT superfamily N-acetyltransferase
MDIIPLSKKYLEETVKMVNDVFPYETNTEWNPERSFLTYINYVEQPESFAKQWVRKIHYWIVLSNTNEVIGVTGLYKTSEDPKDLVWVGWFCVRPNQREKGLGRKLLEWTVEQARIEGYKRLKLYTSTHPNEARAQNLYEKLGFVMIVEEGRRDVYKTIYREKIL